MDFPINVPASSNRTLSWLLESHVKSLPLKALEVRELTATQGSALLFQPVLLLPCRCATIWVHPLRLLLIVNDFFKCKRVSLTLSLGRCHIPRCNPRLIHNSGFPLAGGLHGCCENGSVPGAGECVVSSASPNHRLDLQNDFDHVVVNH